MIEQPAKKSIVLWLLERYVLPLAVATTIAMGASAIAIWQSVSRLTDQVSQQERRLNEIQVQLQAVRDTTITRSELLETMKRVEQQLEIMMLRSGVKPEQPVNLTR